MSQYCFVSLRRGVMLSVTRRKTSVHVPVEKVMTWMGFAPSAEFSAFQPRRPRGTRQVRNTIGLRYFAFTVRSEVLFQVHAGIQRRHLVAVAVVHQRGTLEELSDAPLFGLAPAGMVHVGVHIGIEAVLVGRRLRPGRGRLFFHQPNLHDSLDSLEAVLPGND